jgi:hypothetical protein
MLVENTPSPAFFIEDCFIYKGTNLLYYRYCYMATTDYPYIL